MKEWLDSLSLNAQLLVCGLMLALVVLGFSLTLRPAWVAWNAGDRIESLLWMILTAVIWKPIK